MRLNSFRGPYKRKWKLKHKRNRKRGIDVRGIKKRVWERTPDAENVCISMQSRQDRRQKGRFFAVEVLDVYQDAARAESRRILEQERTGKQCDVFMHYLVRGKTAQAGQG